MHRIFDVGKKYTESTVWCHWTIWRVSLEADDRGWRVFASCSSAWLSLLAVQVTWFRTRPSYLCSQSGEGLGVQMPSQGSMGDRTEPTLLV